MYHINIADIFDKLNFVDGVAYIEIDGRSRIKITLTSEQEKMLKEKLKTAIVKLT